MTSTVDAREAIYQRFVTAWGATTDYTFDSEQYTPPPGVPWVRLTVRHLSSAQETLGDIGNRKFERGGSILLQIFTPLNAGTRAGDTLIDTARNIFEGVRFSGIRCNNAVAREIGASDGYYMSIIETSFLYDETK